MFANPKFSRKNCHAYQCRFVDSEKETSIYGIKAYVNNDNDNPSKTLIQIEIFSKNEKGKEDVLEFVGLSPEDAIRFAREINGLICQVFNRNNHIEDN